MKKILAYTIAICILMSCFSVLVAHAEDSSFVLVDGYYEIDSPEDFIAFRELMSSGEVYGVECNVKLTADIDMTGQKWTPIDEYGFFGGYCGTFDGQGHIISNLTYKTAYDASFFGVLGGATIKNLGLVNIDMQGQNASGIALYSLNEKDITNEIINCFVTGNISGSDYVGGLMAGVNSNGTNIISNSYFYGTINQSGAMDNTGGLVGSVGNYSHLTLSNCFFNVSSLSPYGLGCEVDKYVVLDNVRTATEEEFANGSIAYALNKNGESVFRQTIGIDSFPNFSGLKVYYHNVNCTERTYTNAAEANYDHHLENEVCGVCGANFHRHIYNKNGVCACGDVTHAHIYDENDVCSCGVLCPGEDSDGDGFIEIGTAEQLIKFRDSVNHSTPFKNANAILVADIVFNADVLNNNYSLNGSDFKVWTPLESFSGIFDGKGYTISGLYSTRAYTVDAGFVVVLEKDGIIRNLNIEDSYVEGSYTVGGLVGQCEGKIENSSFEGFIISKTGTAEAGGIAGYSTKTASVINCYSVGCIQIKDGIMAGIVGMDINTPIENCYFSGALSSNSNTAKAYGIAQNGVGCKNCYFDTTKSGKISGAGLVSKECFGKTTSQFNSGELVQYLGEAYGQTVGKDATPVIGGPEVFYGYKDCLSTEKNYGNEVRYEKPTDNHLSIDMNGFCEYCDGTQEGILNQDGFYEISNIGQLYWLRDEVNKGNNTINAVLVEDIVLNRDVLSDDGALNRGMFTAWTPIGTTSSAYNGVFDGNGHSVSGLYYSDVNGLCVGLFGCVGMRGVVRDLTVDDSYLKGKNAVGAIAGYNAGIIESCVNESSVIGGAAVGGIVGLNDGTVENCTDNGWVTSDDELNGGIIGGTNGGTNSGEDSDVPNAGDKNNLVLWVMILFVGLGAVSITWRKRKLN